MGNVGSSTTTVNIGLFRLQADDGTSKDTDVFFQPNSNKKAIVRGSHVWIPISWVPNSGKAKLLKMNVLPNPGAIAGKESDYPAHGSVKIEFVMW